MVEIDKVHKLKIEYDKLTDDQLVGLMHQWREFSEMHVAAKLVLEARREKRDRIRFHLIFWPALVAAISAVIALFK